MTLPETFTLVRHGQSEANVIQQQRKDKALDALPDSLLHALLERHDSTMRLTHLGVEQAEAAGRWLKNSGVPFDRFYVSPHARTRETAGTLHMGGEWRVEDRFRERDWGEIQSWMSPSESSALMKKLSEWYWKPQGGESMATGVRLRVESLMNSLYRKQGSRHVLAVSHGEFIRTAQFVIERMTPDAWTAMDDDPAYKVQNTMIIQYTRVNPEDSTDVSRTFRWRRGICPWDENLSWDNGQWRNIGIKKYSDEDLLKSVEPYEKLF